MTHCLKTIFIVFLFLNFSLYRQTAFAWQSGHSPNQESSYQYDETADTTASDSEEWTEDVVEPPTEDAPSEVQYPEQSYNETHFYEAEGEQAPVTIKREIPKTAWNKLIKDPEFNYEDEAKKPEVSKEYKPSWWERMFGAIFKFLESSAGKTILIIIVTIAVLLLIFRFIQLNGNILFSRKDKKLGQEEIDPENHIPDDWEEEIKRAAQTGNYRLALRYSYRYLLNMLQEKEKITFQVAKTNYQYVYELKGTNLHKPVMQLTREYEYAWYGGFEIGKPFFEHYQQMIVEIKKELNY